MTEVLAQRVDFVEARLAAGVPRADIVAEASSLGIGARTVDRYIATVRHRWYVSAAPTREARRSAFRDDLLREIEEFRRARAFTALASHRRLLAAVDGLTEPVQIDVHHTLEVRMPSPERIAEFRAKVLAQQQRMLEGPALDAEAAAMTVRPVALIETADEVDPDLVSSSPASDDPGPDDG